MYSDRATIAAQATAPGEGAVAVIRISGPDAIVIAARIYSGPVASYATHTAHFGRILSAEKQPVDDVLLLVMRAPRSYTGEDTVEIQCHGGSLIARRVLEVVLKAGARAALPGEFTYQAFRNGKIDLAQAEAVQQIIGAKNELALNAASQQLQGALSQKIIQFQRELVDSAAILEAWVDFPEEGLEFASFEEVIDSLQKTRNSMAHLESTFEEGKKISEGLALCICGAPNVGKSSLMNALLGKERAIVTPIPGTTRDLIEEELRLSGLHFRLIDTAGIRQTDEPIEQEGIRRTHLTMEQADLILFILDATRQLTDEEHALLQNAKSHKTLIIWNKIDLPHSTSPLDFEEVRISAKMGIGLEELKESLQKIIWKKGPPAKDEVLLTSLRHKQALARAISALDLVVSGLKERVSPEFIASDMRATLTSLASVIGMDISEDILSAIFAKFCVGK